MFATFTDWEFVDMDAMVSTGNAMWPKVQAAGALSFKATATGTNTARKKPAAAVPASTQHTQPLKV